MTLTNAYCTVAEFQALSRIDSGGDQTLHEICINAASRLVANVDIGATTAELVDGSPFPLPGAGEWFWMTFERRV